MHALVATHTHTHICSPALRLQLHQYHITCSVSCLLIRPAALMCWLRCALLPACCVSDPADGGEGDYGLSRPPAIDLWECEVSLVQMDGVWRGRMEQVMVSWLQRVYGSGSDWYGSHTKREALCRGRHSIQAVIIF